MGVLTNEGRLNSLDFRVFLQEVAGAGHGESLGKLALLLTAGIDQQADSRMAPHILIFSGSP